MERTTNADPATVQLIAMDLDGTLLRSDGSISAANLRAVEAARAAGLGIAISTGRRHSYAMRALRGLPMQPDDAVISSNGAVVRTASSALLWRRTLSRGLVHRLCTVLQEFRNALVFTLDLFEGSGEDAPGALILEELDQLHGSIRHWMEVNAASIRRVSPLESAFTAEQSPEPIQGMLCGGMARIHQAEALLQREFAGEIDSYRTEYPGNDLCILDILPHGESKGTALLRLAESRAIARENVLAIGDNWNDEPMLRMAGHSALMANAPADLLEHGRRATWTILPPGDADGVAFAIDAVLRDGSLAGLQPAPVR